MLTEPDADELLSLLRGGATVLKLDLRLMPLPQLWELPVSLLLRDSRLPARVGLAVWVAAGAGRPSVAGGCCEDIACHAGHGLFQISATPSRLLEDWLMSGSSTARGEMPAFTVAGGLNANGSRGKLYPWLPSSGVSLLKAAWCSCLLAACMLSCLAGGLGPGKADPAPAALVATSRAVTPATGTSWWDPAHCAGLCRPVHAMP